MTGVIEIYWAWQNVSSLFEWLVWAAAYILPPKLLMTTGDIGFWIKYCVALFVIEGVAGSGGWKRGVVERSEIQWPDKFDVLRSGSEIRNKASNNFVSFSKDTSCPTSNKSNNSSIPSRSKILPFHIPYTWKNLPELLYLSVDHRLPRQSSCYSLISLTYTY